MKILICEEKDILLTTLEFRLSRHGFEVLRANDGEEALAAVDREDPDLMVTDLNTPQLSGLDLLKGLREERKNHMPVIIVGPAEEGDALLTALRAGASDFVTRPFKPLELVLRIRWVLENR